MKINEYNYNEINIGNKFEFMRTLLVKDINNYAELTGDFNPLHCDSEYAKNTIFKNRIVHGMLAGSLFSTLVGMNCPGKKSLYLSQTLNFKTPLFYDDIVTVKGTVIAKNEVIHLITLKTEIIKEGKVCINGEAKIKVLEGT